MRWQARKVEKAAFAMIEIELRAPDRLIEQAGIF
jgi:hypothetical protein